MNKELVSDLAWGVGIVVLALASTYARKLGYIEAETVTRIVMCAIGLMVAWFGNRMPKRFVPNAVARQATRVGGWSLALSGLVYAALWVFAPPQVAVVGGSAAVILGILVTISYCLSLRSKARKARPTP
ncbi:ammonium transporter [Lysobacter panacisoli]|uniref:Ammonium transporter n=1 Tax=Lysobacter panacisoli TaxID=1255263 RepID=A0ABP9LQ23_9GAMM|nr:ammonium transporter [Lysobacter panacisoli]